MSRINIQAVVLPDSEEPRSLQGMIQLRVLRKIKGFSQGDLADAAGVEQSYISKIENGWEGVTLRNLRFIAEALDVEVHELLSPETSAAEAALIKVFRDLSPERQKGWVEMARLAKDDFDQEGE